MQLGVLVMINAQGEMQGGVRWQARVGELAVLGKTVAGQRVFDRWNMMLGVDAMN